MSDCTFFELNVYDSFDFAPTTAVGADALAAIGVTDDSDAVDGSDGDASAGVESEAAPESDSDSDSDSGVDSDSGGVGRVLLAAVAVAVVAVTVARLVSDDTPADLADLDEHERGTAAGDDAPPRPP